MKESEIQRQILDYLAARHILAFRQNTGAMSGTHAGKKWFLRFGAPGMADILAFPRRLIRNGKEVAGYSAPLWIEVKTAKGKQSELQNSFQYLVQRQGHEYVIARSLDDVLEVLSSRIGIVEV